MYILNECVKFLSRVDFLNIKCTKSTRSLTEIQIYNASINLSGYLSSKLWVKYVTRAHELPDYNENMPRVCEGQHR